MQIRSRRYRFWGIFLFVILLGGFCIYHAGSGPNVDLYFEREVPSDASPAILGEAIKNMSNWPHWFFSMADAKILDGLGRPYPIRDQILRGGERILLSMDPRKGKWKRFELEGQVTRFVPNQFLSIQIVKDTSGRLTKLFDRLTWQIELVPQVDQKTLIRATARAHTASWRARFFGKIAERILMNQVFYPDLSALATTKQPLAPNPFSQLSE